MSTAELATLLPQIAEETQLAAVTGRLKWLATARKKQIPPDWAWTQWGIMAGRGFGKTLTGAQWLWWEAWQDPQALPSAVIAPTFSDVKFTCFEGPAGLLSVIPPELVESYNATDMLITLKNGATIRGFSAERPERLRGPQHARIWCFIAGTLVSTPYGDRPIESLRPGDTVLTRKGPRRVLANSVREDVEVGEVSFANGASLVGTADHPVYLKSGWTRLDRLQIGDTACAINASSGAASAGTATKAATTNAPTSRFARSARYACTALSGKLSAALSPRATTCITSTRTKATTASTTSSASDTARTNPSTSPIGQYLARIGLKLPSFCYPALIAALSCAESAHRAKRAALAAIKSVRTALVKAGAAAYAAATSFDRAPATSAASVASTWQPQGRQSVYCLKVEGEPEYFANGILVHNCDELAAWQYADDTWDMAMMGLRLGAHPRIIWTTTPKPVELVRKLVKPSKTTEITNGSTYENKDHLPQTFFDQLTQYEGTTLGRQELEGELIDPEEAGIIKRSWFKLWPAKKPLPQFEWIIMSLDTAFTEATYDSKKGDPDYTACTVWGVFWHENKSNILLLDCWQDQLGMPDLIKRVKKELNVAYGDDQDVALIKPMYGSAKPITSGRKPDILLIEDKGSGISLRQMLEREGITAYAYNPGRADKLTRLHMVSPVFARNLVWLPESDKHPGRPRTWVDPLLHQLCAFTGPKSLKHDDYVDASTQAIRLCMDKGLVDAVKARQQDKAPPKAVINPYAV